MKLVINIPCYNEEKTLPLVLKELPKKIPGIDEIEVQIVDDGSSDNTVEVARRYGCRIIRHKRNLGLGVAFKHGMQIALENGADIVVNTDADNQYPSKYIKDLVKPILEERADIVIGDRQPWKVKHFSPVKRLFQFIGNTLTRKISGTDVQDTVSGFRAYSKEALLRINVTTRFSYVLDTIVQGGWKGLKIVSVPITINLPTRKSRLFKNIFQHMRKSGYNISRVYVIYEPFKTFLWGSLLFFIPGLVLLARFAYYFATGAGAGHVQSLIVATMFILLGALVAALGVLAGLLGINRMLIEEQLYLKKKELYSKK